MKKIIMSTLIVTAILVAVIVSAGCAAQSASQSTTPTTPQSTVQADTGKITVTDMPTGPWMSRKHPSGLLAWEPVPCG